MAGKFRKTLEWITHIETINALLHLEFVRTLLAPTLVAAMTGTAGLFGHIPFMWVIMATALAFMGTTQGMLRASEYVERKNPLNKLTYIGTHFGFVLDDADLPVAPPAGNRQQRRAQGMQPQQTTKKLMAGTLAMNVHRTISKGQINLELQNNASFPLSCLLFNATTEVAGKTPPRSIYPRAAATLQPGAKFRVGDTEINMEHTPCGRIPGKMDFVIRYGLPGKEHFELRLTGDLDIVMQPFGLLQHVATGWRN